MPTTEKPPVPELLRQAIEEAGTSVRGLARTLAGKEATERQIEAERRTLYKYLDGTQPEPPKARALAKALKKPRDHFVRPISRGSRLREKVAELEAEKDRLQREIRRLRDET